VATIGPRKGDIAAGGRGRHGGGEPLWCLRATKTIRRHEAARNAPRQLCRSSYTQVPCRTHHVHAPSSGVVVAEGWREKKPPRKPRRFRGRTRVPRDLVDTPHTHTHARTHARRRRERGGGEVKGEGSRERNTLRMTRHEAPRGALGSVVFR